MNSAASQVLEQLRLGYARNERVVSAGFFAAGFVFDILTVGRIDSWLTIAQQALYLALCAFILLQMLLEAGAPPREGRWWRWRGPLLHFLLGALLSVYAIFFFKSSSLLVSFSFLAFLVALLVANESERFKALGLPFKFALLSLCLLCFAAAVVPIAVGSMGLGVFLLSMLTGAAPLAAAGWRLHARGGRRAILVPLGAVLAMFLGAYLLRVVPPVPLSIPFIGIYHHVERTPEGFVLSHERPWWRFWHHGDQHFRAQPGDRVYVFFRVFSPAKFSDQVLLRWHRRTDAGWALQDSVPIGIVGGREEGFRGYGFKANYEPGRWKLQVETTDGREIGRIYFELETLPPGERTFSRSLQ
ncbi:MAG TPA: DUF2914 domain-containing protein [Burkholderiales bacterium]|nr:DUF2914 domain-containing protein [Burkholderiales bacterium]